MNNNVKNKNKGLNIIIVLSLIIGCILIYLGSIKKNDIPVYYSYNVRRSNTSRITLKQNLFYEDKDLIYNKEYPSELIDLVNLNFTYVYEGSKPTNINYSYDLTASIIGNYRNNDNLDSTVWQKDYVLKKGVNKLLTNSRVFTISEDANINYKAYNDLVNLYKHDFKFAVDTYLSVKLNVEYSINGLKENSKGINNIDAVEVRIPLNDTVTKVITNYDKQDSKNYSVKGDYNSINKYYIIIGIIFLAIAVTIYIGKIKSSEHSSTDLYRSMINKILKEYEDIIVTVSNKPDIKDLKIMYVTNMDDLVDVSQLHSSTIIHYEAVKGSETWFMVLSDEYVYIYKIKITDF